MDASTPVTQAIAFKNIVAKAFSCDAGTIHSKFGIKCIPGPKKAHFETKATRENLEHEWGAVMLGILDEVSMVDAELYS